MNEYIDLYLKFESENQANYVLFSNQIIESETIKTPRYSAIDSVGIIYKDSIPLEGWHVNVRVTPEEDVSELEPYRIPEPSTPSRIWV